MHRECNKQQRQTSTHTKMHRRWQMACKKWCGASMALQLALYSPLHCAPHLTTSQFSQMQPNRPQVIASKKKSTIYWYCCRWSVVLLCVRFFVVVLLCRFDSNSKMAAVGLSHFVACCVAVCCKLYISLHLYCSMYMYYTPHRRICVFECGYSGEYSRWERANIAYCVCASTYTPHYSSLATAMCLCSYVETCTVIENAHRSTANQAAKTHTFRNWRIKNKKMRRET